VRPLADQAGLAASDLVEYDARTAAEAALRIERERLRAKRLAYQLDALCAALAVAAAWIAWRTNRHVQRAQEEHRRLVERKAEELEQFAGRVAHDILSPLATVSIALALAERSAPQAKDALGRGHKSLLRVRGIVDGLLGFARAGARPEPGARAEVQPLVSGLEEELALFAAQNEAELRIEPVPRFAVSCTPGVLLSLLSNLLRNGLKYVGDAAVRQVTLRVKPRRGRVLFEVEDTGPGIKPAEVQRIFEPYVRGHNAAGPGIGLGLATVKRLVDSHGGLVGVRPGARGALFWFELNEAESLREPMRDDSRRADLPC
jgi:signal transduction histidine kinase